MSVQTLYTIPEERYFFYFKERCLWHQEAQKEKEEKNKGSTNRFGSDVNSKNKVRFLFSFGGGFTFWKCNKLVFL